MHVQGLASARLRQSCERFRHAFHPCGRPLGKSEPIDHRLALQYKYLVRFGTSSPKCPTGKRRSSPSTISDDRQGNELSDDQERHVSYGNASILRRPSWAVASPSGHSHPPVVDVKAGSRSLAGIYLPDWLSVGTPPIAIRQPLPRREGRSPARSNISQPRHASCDITTAFFQLPRSPGQVPPSALAFINTC